MFRLFLFGSPVLTGEDKPIQIRRKRSMALLAYIAMHERPQSREVLAALFWPENDQSSAFGNLRRELARLKADVGKQLIISDRKTIGINPAADLWIDVQAFLAGIENQEMGTTAAALDYYKDDFMVGLTLPDCPGYDEWQFFLSESLRESLANALQRHLEAQAQEQDYPGAIETTRRWLSLDNLHEPAHRTLMRLYALAGQYSAAIRQYHICAKNLETELGVEPEEETQALLNAIQTKEIGPPADKEPEPLVIPGETEPAAPVRIHVIPAFPDVFVGRKETKEEIIHQLTQTDCRLLTVRGIGGIGKTRLAVQALSAMVETDYFPDGLFFVNLAGVDSIEYLVPAIAETLEFPLAEANDPVEQLSTYLHDKDMLLLLDNFEHLQSGSFHLSKLLKRCPRLKILVTSRHQLNITGEVILVLDGLALPQKTGGSSEAVQLFQERARQFAPGMDFGPEKLFIQAICRLVGGMPLAIEMCAAWVQTINCQEILAEIQQGLDLLESYKTDLPERHLSIKAVFQSSLNLLTAAEQETLLALTIFRGSFSYKAARQVAGASLVQLRSLVEKSLLGTFGKTAETRYQMHTLLRQFAMEKISAAKMAELETNHTIFFTELLENLAPKRCTVENPQIISTVFTEVDNLRSVWQSLGRLIEQNEHTELVCRSVEKIIPTWNYAYIYQTNFLEASQLLHTVWQPMEALNWESAGGEQKKAFAIISSTLARFFMELSQFEDVNKLCRRSLDIFQNQINQQPFGEDYITTTLRTWARADIRLGSYDQAKQKLLTSLENSTYDLSKAGAVFTLGMISSVKGDYEEALQYYREALDLYGKCHQENRLLSTINGIGAVYGRQRQFEEAIAHYQKVVPGARRTGQRVTLMIALNNLAFCLKQVGRLGRVGDYFEEALQVATELGKQRWQAVIAQDFGLFLLEQGELQKAKDHIQNGLRLAVALNSQADMMAGLLPVIQWQAQKGLFEEAMVTAAYVKNSKLATAETHSYAADIWDELSSELPPIFTDRAKARLEHATLDDILEMIPD